MIEEIISQDFNLESNSLDKNYQDFFKKTNQLLDELEAREQITKETIEKTNAFFENYLSSYFKAEEQLQKKSNYPYYEEHKQIHQTLYNRINSLLTELKKDYNFNKVDKVYHEIQSLFKTHIYYIEHNFTEKIAN